VTATPAGSLAGRTAIVTGSTKGIGRAIALAFARAGMHLVVNSRHAGECAATAAECAAAGVTAIPLAADLADAAAARRFAAGAAEALGHVDVLVNNAGGTLVAPSEALPEAEWRRTLDLNLTAYFVLSQEVGRRMLERGRGSIINVSSVTGTVAFPRRLAYCVSKAGVDMLSKVLAVEWAGRGVRVNALAPGYVETEMIRDLASRRVLDQATLARRTPLGRLAAPSEIAEAALFLAGDASSYVTGAVLHVDGGWTAYGHV
jgi:NAD(P)-dependent dehydrogenase (short-subunit alcohol dehydrogenase family)